jgi:hypothetical protein
MKSCEKATYVHRDMKIKLKMNTCFFLSLTLAGGLEGA